MNLTICSPYRDLEYQQMLFNRKIERYMKRGMSYMEAYQLSSQAVTVPEPVSIRSVWHWTLSATTICRWTKALEIRKQENGWQPTAVVLALFYDTLKARKTSRESNMNLAFSLCGKAAATVIMEQGISLEEFWEEYVEDVSID